MNKEKNRKKAVAIRYDPEKGSVPKVAAKGSGALAEKIIEIAEASGVLIHQDKDLVEVLSKLNIEEDIPPDVYVVVAELLAFVYAINGKIKR
ncbi:MAG: EscU/YscU/HrcU family type III secretion system export apparatus switch protein [Proteobacteria bacterium]|nr:EscU/YscU/HrcU family type III secretion system export apparatus switch protein [Pseudomonadota bacterium]